MNICLILARLEASSAWAWGRASRKTAARRIICGTCRLLGSTAWLLRGVQWLAGEVVEAEREQGEHDDADRQSWWRGLRSLEAPELPVAAALLRDAFAGTEGNAQEADNSAGGDKAGGVETAGRDLGFGVEGWSDTGWNGQASQRDRSRQDWRLRVLRRCAAWRGRPSSA